MRGNNKHQIQDGYFWGRAGIEWVKEEVHRDFYYIDNINILFKKLFSNVYSTLGFYKSVC